MSWRGPDMVPAGVLELVLATTVRMSSSETPRAAAATGSTWTRTANFCAPYTSTWATPGSWDICCASVVSPYSSTCDSGRVGEIRLMYMIGNSAGFTLGKLGGMVISMGSLRAATVSAVCTSSAAPSMLRVNSNCTVIDDWPSEDVDTIEVMPAMVASWRSIGAATEAAMVSALAPGRVAVMLMVGKSTAGRAATGSSRKAKIPNTMNDAVISVVMTG